MLRVLPIIFLPILLFGFLELFLWSNLTQTVDVVSAGLWSYIVIATLGYIGIVLSIILFSRSPLERSGIVNLLIGIGFAAIIQKFSFLFFLVLFQIFLWTGSLIIVVSYDYNSLATLAALALSLLPFIAMIYGVLWGKYNYKVEELELEFKDLPTAFDGFTVVQISDIHSGTWDSLKGVEKGISIIEKIAPDLLVFTGDLVNGNKEEINPFMDLFKRLNSPYGKYAVLGNHDYYGQPRAADQKTAYFDDFFSKYKEMGFDLILNEHRKIEKEGDKLTLVGVENWGSGRYFPKRGDLIRATTGVDHNDFTILLSHDPSHWEIKALEFPKHFHLTLSGHTHGMQFGINLPFFKWSPVQYRYKKWMGLYEDQGQFLYVNRGFGVLAYPGRVGMSPEITKITLKRTT